MNRIAIKNGTYKAISEVCVGRFTDTIQIDYVVYKPGEQFEITADTGRIAREYLVHHPEYDNTEPRYERVA